MSKADECNSDVVEDVQKDSNGHLMAPPAKEKPQSQTASSTPSSGSSGKTTITSSSGTSSSADTLHTSSQEVSSDASAQPDSSVWGIANAMQKEFFHLDLTNDYYTFGRAKQCDYCFDIPSIRNHKHHKLYSKKQFAIKRTVNPDGSTNQVILEDLGGTNGTFVNGEKVPSKKQRQIRNNDKIGLAYAWSNVFMFIDNQAHANPLLPQNFSRKYIINKLIGKGACGEVFEVWLKEGVGQFACKIISKSRLSLSCVSVNSLSRDAMSEAKILQQLNHPCIIAVEDVIDSPRNLYIVLEYAAGGELFERLSQKGQLPEPLAKLYFYQMLCAVNYLHENGITHRDLKPENILLMTKSEPTLIKITDFGMSRLVEEQSLMRTLAGTPSYLAPEIIERLQSQASPGYTKLVDMWSLGVILYVCLVAYPPFSNARADTPQHINQQILTANFNFNHDRWKTVSHLAKQLITFLLKLNAVERLTPNQTLQHEWLQDVSMQKKALELMDPQSHSVDFNLMGEKSLSSDSVDTRKVSTDNDVADLSNDSLTKLSAQKSSDSELSGKRSNESSEVCQAKCAKLG